MRTQTPVLVSTALCHFTESWEERTSLLVLATTKYSSDLISQEKENHHFRYNSKSPCFFLEMAQSSRIRNVLRGKIRVAHVAENSCIFGIPPRSSLEQYLYLSILQEQRACSTCLQQSPTPDLATEMPPYKESRHLQVSHKDLPEAPILWCLSVPSWHEAQMLTHLKASTHTDSEWRLVAEGES